MTGQLGPTRSDQMGWKQRPIASAGRANLAWIRIVQDRSILSRLSECRSDHSASYRPTASPINLDWTTHDSNPHFHLQKGLLASDPGDPICKVRGLSIAAIKIVTAQQPFSIVRARLHHCPVPSPQSPSMGAKTGENQRFDEWTVGTESIGSNSLALRNAARASSAIPLPA